MYLKATTVGMTKGLTGALGVEDFITTVDTCQVKCVSHVWFRRYFITENNFSVEHPVLLGCTRKELLQLT